MNLNSSSHKAHRCATSARRRLDHRSPPAYLPCRCNHLQPAARATHTREPYPEHDLNNSLIGECADQD